MRYVALGSSMAAGPGIPPRAGGSNFRDGRSERNYPHLLARHLGYDLVDVTSSGATTAHLTVDRQHGDPPQVEALDGTEELVTITVGGNDIGYVPALIAATLPGPLRALARGKVRAAQRLLAGHRLASTLEALGSDVRRRAPRARVLFVDYLTLLPLEGEVPAFAADDLRLCRDLEIALTAATAAASQASGCELVRASRASRDHHPWAAIPWTNGPSVPLPGKPMPFHPNELGMRAVAGLIEDHLSG